MHNKGAGVLTPLLVFSPTTHFSILNLNHFDDRIELSIVTILRMVIHIGDNTNMGKNKKRYTAFARTYSSEPLRESCVRWFFIFVRLIVLLPLLIACRNPI